MKLTRIKYNNSQVKAMEINMMNKESMAIKQ